MGEFGLIKFFFYFGYREVGRENEVEGFGGLLCEFESLVWRYVGFLVLLYIWNDVFICILEIMRRKEYKV